MRMIEATLESEGRQRKFPHGFALSVVILKFTSEIFRHTNCGVGAIRKWS